MESKEKLSSTKKTANKETVKKEVKTNKTLATSTAKKTSANNKKSAIDSNKKLLKETTKTEAKLEISNTNLSVTQTNEDVQFLINQLEKNLDD